MDASGKLQLTHLRTLLSDGRAEKTALAKEIASSLTSPGRKEQAVHRYSRLIRELRMIADELEVLLAAEKLAEASKNV
jgi:hypothetical protein